MSGKAQRNRKKRRSSRKGKNNRYKRRSVLLFILFIALLGCGFYLKDRLSYYFHKFKAPKEYKQLTNTPTEHARIDRIVEEHTDKTFGIDLSHYQSSEDLNWDSLSIGYGSVPIEFVVLRASMGSNGVDLEFDEFWEKAAKHNLVRGAYHFYRPDEDPILQANQFLSAVQLESGDLRPVVDIEKYPKIISKKKLRKNLQIFLDILEERFGEKPIIYTYYHYYKEELEGHFDSYPLWIANYNDVLAPNKESPWLIWQFTENGIVHGISTKVDLNIYNGSLRSLKSYTLR